MFKVTFYQNQNGNKPALDFINKLDETARKKVYQSMRLLKNFGNTLRFPDSKPLEGEKGLFELRVQDRTTELRFFYFFVIGNEIIITNGCTKKGKKQQQRAIKLAAKYKGEYTQQR